VQELDPVQIRVLGCLLEKQQTTPDAYPLTLNSLRLACNQTTSRDTVRDAAQRLGQRGLVRLASYHGGRASKYRHLVDDALGLAEDERALLCVLMLRGPQTLGEVKQRTEKIHRFASLSEVAAGLDRLAARGLGQWLDRRPGQKEARYAHLLEAREAGAEPATVAEPEPDGLAAEVTRLREDMDALRRDLDALRARLG
jgi:uncharacterized protein YceH (UPF0502 family)